MAFIIGLPVVQTILFCYSIGHDPKGITVSVINHEINYPEEQCGFSPGCNSTKLSCNYLDHLKKNYTMKLVRSYKNLVNFSDSLFVDILRYGREGQKQCGERRQLGNVAGPR